MSRLSIRFLYYIGGFGINLIMDFKAVCIEYIVIFRSVFLERVSEMTGS